jgi:hypothetical protein
MRSRNLKPSIFTNELLAVADPLFTVIFEGLWCAADREGRLEDRPAKIHMAINPGRAFEGTERSLGWLSENKFILRYTLDGVAYIQVLMFWKHQNPHFKEAPSVIPKAPGFSPTDEGKASGFSPMDDNKALGEPEASTNLGRCSPPNGRDKARLIPDSGSLIPSSLIPDSGSLIPDPPFTAPAAQNGHAVESEKEIRTRIDSIKAVFPKAARQDWVTAEKLIRNLVTQGTTWETIIDGVERYARLCTATNRQAQNPGFWFGAIDQPWLQEWAIHAGKAAAKTYHRKTADELEAEEAARDAQH